MTTTLIPFREKKHAPSTLHQGSYYGWRLRAILDTSSTPSIIERFAIFYREHPSFARTIFIFGVMGAAGTLALWIVR